jgi:hypothetical protein
MYHFQIKCYVRCPKEKKRHTFLRHTFVSAVLNADKVGTTGHSTSRCQLENLGNLGAWNPRHLTLATSYWNRSILRSNPIGPCYDTSFSSTTRRGSMSSLGLTQPILPNSRGIWRRQNATHQYRGPPCEDNGGKST